MLCVYRSTIVAVALRGFGDGNGTVTWCLHALHAEELDWAFYKGPIFAVLVVGTFGMAHILYIIFKVRVVLFSWLLFSFLCLNSAYVFLVWNLTMNCQHKNKDFINSWNCGNDAESKTQLALLFDCLCHIENIL